MDHSALGGEISTREKWKYFHTGENISEKVLSLGRGRVRLASRKKGSREKGYYQTPKKGLWTGGAFQSAEEK